MNKPHFKLLDSTGKLTTFLFENCVHVLCRSADWYGFSPVKRYLVNMAASVIRMEDAKTETREFTRDNFLKLVDLLEESKDNTPDAAFEAWKLWGVDGREFGVVHLNLDDGKRGDLILGDDPNDVWQFWPWIDPKDCESDPVYSARGVEGSDV